MKNAQNAIISGCSAGGLISILHYDRFRALLLLGVKEIYPPAALTSPLNEKTDEG